MKLKCIAVDDEPLALGLISSYIEQTPFLELVGRYSNALEALNAVLNESIQVIFLDIEMPGLTGLELARVLSKSRTNTLPRVIFTTAYNQFALEGYRVDALDYLLKPFNYEEFLRAAAKCRDYYELVRINQRIPAVTNDGESYLYLKVEYQLIKVSFTDILFIEGLKDYVKVHLQGQEKAILSLTSLKSLEEKLPAEKFMRVHRSFIVSLDKISSITKNTLQIEKNCIPVGDQFKEPFRRFFSRWT